MLLSRDPASRKQVYSIWGIENREKHFLAPFSEAVNVRQSQMVSDLADTKKKGGPKASNIQQTGTVQGAISPVYIPPLPLGQIGNRQNSPSIQFSTARNTSDSNRTAVIQNNPQYIHVSRNDAQINSVQFVSRPGQQVQGSASPQSRMMNSQPVVREKLNLSAEKESGYMSFKDYLNKEDITSQINQNSSNNFSSNLININGNANR
jgi:hypothetical protein